MRYPNTILLILTCFMCFLLFSCKSKKEAPVGDNEPVTAAKTSSRTTTPTGPLVSCPVCGLTFHQDEAAQSVQYKNKNYYFYLKDHAKAFALSPENYVPVE